MNPNVLLKWDEDGKRLYETGVSHGVLYPKFNGGKGVAWNGLTAVNEQHEGGETTAQYADDIKYLNLISREEFKATIEAFTYPDEFAECDGSLEVKPGVFAGQQKRKPFGFSYVTRIGNDEEQDAYGYKIHLVYNCLAAPSDKNYETVNDTPSAITFSWEVSTTPEQTAAGEPTAHIEIDSTKVNADQLAAFEAIIYGSGTTQPRLPLPDEVFGMFSADAHGALTGISITTSPSDVSYTVGETFDPTGMVVSATYENSLDPVVLNAGAYTYAPNGALAATDTEITVSYTEGGVTKTATQAITVTPGA